MNPRSVLIVVAHPDDEVLGCGGTIAKLSEAGATVNVLYVADGESARRNEVADSASILRRRAAEHACQILGATPVDFLDFPDNRLDAVALLDVVKEVERVVNELGPEMVITHHCGDVNVDHRRVHEAVVVACRPQPGGTVRAILCFEVPSSTEWQFAGSTSPFVPNWFEDITPWLPKKELALQAYASELRPWPHSRSLVAINHLTSWRGASVGLEAAEAFVLGRCIR